MEIKCRKVLVLAYAVMSSAMALCDGAATNGTMSANANQTTNANASIEASIQVVAAGLAGNADVDAMHDVAATLFSRIEDEKDPAVFHAHMENMQNAILGIRFREGPMADSYDGWVRSIDHFNEMCDQCSSTMWRRTRDWQRLWEFRLKQMALVRKERERIADAKQKPDPPDFEGVHSDLSSVQDMYRCCIENILRRVFSWDNHFCDFYHGLPQSEQKTWQNRIEAASGMKFEFSPENKQRIRDRDAHRPYDGGDVLPHPFTFFGCTLGTVHESSQRLGKGTSSDEIMFWTENFRFDEPYFGKQFMFAKLGPRSKIAYSAEFSWTDKMTRKVLFEKANEIKGDLEKRFGVTLGVFVFELGGHVCDEATWWKAGGVSMMSRSVFGPIMIEINAVDDSRGLIPPQRLELIITDTAAVALVEKERRENPLKYDREAERRRMERMLERSRQRKAMKDAQKAGGEVQ